MVMAAGLSRRFGGDKRRAMLPEGGTLLQATLGLAQRSLGETWVVLRQRDDPAQLGIPAAVRVLHAPAAGVGLGTSLATAFAALLDEASEESNRVAAAVMLGDMPWVSPNTCRRLAERAHSERILCPRHAGSAGHPVVFGRAFWPRLSRLGGDQGAHQVLKESAAACEFIAVDDPGTVRDVDRPQDLMD